MGIRHPVESLGLPGAVSLVERPRRVATKESSDLVEEAEEERVKGGRVLRLAGCDAK